METPQDENRAWTRSRHVPTPKMSDRKKSLFSKSQDLVRFVEDSDLGPMSPLKFSNSPKRNPMKVLNITSFRNILGNASPDSDRSLSPDFERRFSHSDLYEILPASYHKENEIVDEETRLSFPNGTPRMPAHTESAQLDETNSNSLSMLMSSDLNIVDKTNPILKTPGLSDAVGQKKEPRTSFRKMSLHENTSTPSDDCKANSFSELTSECRARTSLSFSDIRPISTKSFYSTKASPEVQKPASNSTQTYSYDRLPKKRVTSNPRKKQSVKKRNNSIRLGSFNRGVFHKIKKPTAKKAKATVKKLSTSQIIESTDYLLEKQSSPVLIKPSVQSKSAPSSPQKPDPMKQQIERIRKILTSNRNPIKQATPLQLSRSMMDLTNNSSLYDEDGTSEGSSCEGEEGGSFEKEMDSHDDEAKSDVGGRKFFKSSSNRRIKREYKVVNNVSATVRKGGQISLKPIKQKKRKYRSLFEEEFDFASEQLEVDDIISKLNGSQVESNPVCVDQSSPCKPAAVVKPPVLVEPEPTEQIECIDALLSGISNDEPIAVQPNIIYVDRLSPLLNGAGSNSEESCCSSRASLFSEDLCMQTEYQESPTMQLRTMTSSLTITRSFNFSDQLRETSELISTVDQTLFPIFYKDHQRKLAAPPQNSCHNTIFDIIRRKPKRLRMARGVGSNQYQIDAGQKEYGGQQCPECGLVYSVHEPEEELIHKNYHSSLHVLRFTGWSSEVVASHVPEWDVTGRVLVVGMTAGKHKLQKVQEVLAVVDRELGFVEPCQLVIGSVAYLAVARGAILGICVVQPLQQANRLLTIEGTEGSIDCCTMETYSVKCGISRIWVSPSFRSHGIARTLLTVMKSHFVFGYQMSYDEIAFSAPTEAGKRLAEAVTGRKDFLIYM